MKNILAFYYSLQLFLQTYPQPFDEYKNHTIEEMAAIENLPIELIKIKLKYI